MIIASSILDPIYSFVSAILAVFYGATRSYAISIALLTIVIMVVVLPLTLKSTKSMLEMQQLQPELKKLQQQYTDMQQRNEAMMALYKEHNVSPLGGCVPMLLPLPVFIVMWRIIRGMTRVCTTKLLTQPKYASLPLNSFCPEHIKETSRLFKDLAGKTKMLSFGLDLSQPALETIKNNVVRGIPYVLLVLLVTASSYYQQRQVTLRNANASVNPQQQMLLKVFPLITGAFSLFFPAALIMYWLVQNVFRIGQNAYITRRFYGEGGLGHKAAQASQAAKAIADVKKADKGDGGKTKALGAKPTAPTKPGSTPKPGSGGKASGSPKPPSASRPSPDRPKPSRPTPPRPKPKQK
jgi:YidC/Oxa1 family membrane protein insertase